MYLLQNYPRAIFTEPHRWYVNIGPGNGIVPAAIWATTQINIGPLSTYWSRVTHVCVSKLTIIDSDNGLSPCRRQAIIWTNDGILITGSLGTNFSEISIGIQTFPFKKMHLKMSSAKWRPFCLGLNVLNYEVYYPLLRHTISLKLLQ